MRVAWMLEELGQPYERVEISLDDESTKSDPDFRAASPMGKVPALADGQNRMAESAAICLYLADRYASGRLAPTVDDGRRGSFLYWMFYTPGVLEPAMAEKFSGMEPNRRSYGWGDFPTMIATLELAVAAGPWLFGDWFTAADVMIGSSAAFLKLFGILPAGSPIDEYILRCQDRPAYQRAQSFEPAPE